MSDGKYLYKEMLWQAEIVQYLENFEFSLYCLFILYAKFGRQDFYSVDHGPPEAGELLLQVEPRLHKASFPSKQLVPEKLLGGPGSGMKTCHPLCAASKAPRQPNTRTRQEQIPPALPSASWASSAQEL